MENQKTTPVNDKKASVGSMFDDIAPRYDFLNHFLSFGIDRIWRRKAVKIISRTHKNADILDVATGTGDLAIAALKLDPKHITGIDISEKMLAAGREKIRRKGLSEKITLITGESEKILFPDNRFDVAMSSFGVRNFADPLVGLTEMGRVLRSGGLIVVLEFSRPSAFPFRQIYKFYFLNILPSIGRIFSKNKVAYSYLPETVMKFPENEEFLKLLEKAGFTELKQERLTLGIASIYTGLIFKTQ
ncbi:MAG TPA: bifunctional demethylmenaquinone methyltransferase/2-methoxy-6-polyprenyl-1,4-benzoquinol methylase UbiE [Bacteroidales bacterium]|nr:bifunctional demethylmenaquinone methyltransferase/2-methoxy-6-polyprenyl-1,4-benzoquinol methylase UbiE [Bacteroidales bacterium]